MNKFFLKVKTPPQANITVKPYPIPAPQLSFLTLHVIPVFKVLVFEVLVFEVLIFEVLVFEVLVFEVLIFEILVFEVLVFGVLVFEVLGLRSLLSRHPYVHCSNPYYAIDQIPSHCISNASLPKTTKNHT